MPFSGFQSLESMVGVSLLVPLCGLLSGLQREKQGPSTIGRCIGILAIQSPVKLTARRFKLLGLKAFHTAYKVMLGIIFRCCATWELRLSCTRGKEQESYYPAPPKQALSHDVLLTVYFHGSGISPSCFPELPTVMAGIDGKKGFLFHLNHRRSSTANDNGERLDTTL